MCKQVIKHFVIRVVTGWCSLGVKHRESDRGIRHLALPPVTFEIQGEYHSLSGFGGFICKMGTLKIIAYPKCPREN